MVIYTWKPIRIAFNGDPDTLHREQRLHQPITFNRDLRALYLAPLNNQAKGIFFLLKRPFEASD